MPHKVSRRVVLVVILAGCAGNDGGTGESPAIVFTALANGVGLAVPATETGDAEYYSIVVPAGHDTLTVYVSIPAEGTGSGNPNLTVYTAKSLATLACSAATGGADMCSVSPVNPGTYAIKVSAASAFSGYEVRAIFNGPFLVQGVTAGGSHSCGLTANGTAYCWGSNGKGNLGDGTTSDHLTPALVAGGLGFVSLSAGGVHTCGLTSGGVAYCWGSNGYGKLGDGTISDRLTPTAVTGGLTFTNLSVGDNHSCGLTGVGTLYCWGWNGFGQLGDGTTTLRLAPVAVSGGLHFTSLGAGEEDHTCGLVASGAAYCWGWNGFGQLGDGSTTTRMSPVPVAGGLTFSSIAGGGYFTCGLTTAGKAYCWGWNGFGQLGDGTTNNSSAPVAVGGGHTFTSISSSRVGGIFTTHTCGVTDTGAAYCWGGNQFNVPVPVAGGLTFASVSAGSAHNCGRTALGVAYCWGFNGTGQDGDGTTTDRVNPVAVIAP